MAYNGALTYIHKVKNGRDIYFFANSSEKPVDTKVVLRGESICGSGILTPAIRSRRNSRPAKPMGSR